MNLTNKLFKDKLIDKDTFLNSKNSEDIINYLYENFNANNNPIEGLITAIEENYKIKYVNLKKKTILKESLNSITKELINKYNIYCIDRTPNSISLVTYKPIENFERNVELIEEFYPLKVELFFAFKNEIEESISNTLNNKNRQVRSSENTTTQKIDENYEVIPEKAAQKAQEIIQKGIDFEASDIHIEPLGEKGIRVRLRVDGDLMPINDFFIHPKEYDNIIARIKIMANMDTAEKRKSQDGKIANVEFNGVVYDLRVSSMFTIFGEKIVIRLIKKITGNKDLSTLGFNKEEMKIIDRLLAKPNGILLVTGQTGSGKSTSVYTMINMLNNEDVNICTVEDPVESEVIGISQVQVNELAGISFPSSLRTFLRQDPDIIMVGEIRDLETGEIAIKAANTGHFVLSTVHTNNATATINRLISMGIEAYKISEGIVGIVSQRLVKKLCPYCKKEHILSRSEKDRFDSIITKNKLGSIDNFKFYENNPLGCPHCNKGFKGRTVVAEVLEFNEKINNLIAKNTTAVELRESIIQDRDIFLPFEYTAFKRSEDISIETLREFL